MLKHRIAIANIFFFIFLLIVGYHSYYVVTSPSDNTDGSFFTAEYMTVGDTYGENNPLKKNDLITHINGVTL